jgi:hypothetical protein
VKKNESNLDRIIRVIVGIILATLYLTGTISGTLGIVFLVLGIVLFLTGVVGFCAIYSLLKINTNKA